MNCPKCFKENPSNAVFCQNCGVRILSSSQNVNPNFITIGRFPDNIVCINQQEISGKHARIFAENGQVFIEDLNSTNGTFVNGVRISRTALRLNDDVKLGQVNFNLNDAQIKNLFPSTGTPPAISKTAIETGISSPMGNSNYSGFNHLPHTNTPNINQINVNVTNTVAPKSVGTALVLTFFFGPLGMFYSTTTGGIVMVSINLLIFLLGLITLGIAWFGYIITHPICMIWAAIAVNEINKIPNVNIQSRNQL